MTTHDRRRRQHNVRQTLRRLGWYDLAHRHRRRHWRVALRQMRGRVLRAAQ